MVPEQTTRNKKFRNEVGSWN